MNAHVWHTPETEHAEIEHELALGALNWIDGQPGEELSPGVFRSDVEREHWRIAAERGESSEGLDWRAGGVS